MKPDTPEQTIQAKSIPSTEAFGTATITTGSAHEVDTAGVVHASKSATIGTASEVSTAGVIHASKSPASPHLKTDSKVSAHDNETETDGSGTIHEEPNSSTQAPEPPITAQYDGSSTYQDKAPQASIAGSANVQAAGSILKAGEVIGKTQDAASETVASEIRGKTTEPRHESTDAGDSVKATVINGPERATHHSLNDAAATEDSIGFTPYVKALSKLLCHENTNTPLVVGIFGEWGAGKTSFMRFLEKEVQHLGITPSGSWYKPEAYQQKHSVRQVWFNAWKHDVQSDLWVALLQAITTQVESDTPPVALFWRRFKRLWSWRFFWSLLAILVALGGSLLYPEALSSNATQQNGTPTPPKGSDSWQLLLAFASATLPPTITTGFLYWLGAFTPITNLVRRLKTPLGLDIKELLHGKSLPDKIERFRVFEKELEVRLNDYLEKNGRLIIYIDDLDRCSPEHAVEIIEAINLFLDTDRCIFILGMDNTLIANSIELKYKEVSKAFKEQRGKEQRRYGEFFLDKIIQIPISVPAMQPQEVVKYLQTELIQEPELKAAKSDQNLPATPPKDHANLPPLDIPISKDTQDTLLTLLPYLEPNPRTIKRFYNMLTFVHFFYIANRKDLGAVNDASLTMWFFLQYKFPEEIKTLRNPQKQNFLYNEDTGFRELALTGNPACPEISAFFQAYKSSSEKAPWVLEQLKGKVAFYFPATRFLVT